MKKSTRLFIKGSVNSMFFEQFIKENIEKLNLKGYFRKLEDSRIELFLEGDFDKVNEMTTIAKRGTPHTQIRSVEEQTASFQGFKEFKFLRI